MNDPSSSMRPQEPEIGTIVETINDGRQQVMDIVGLPFDERTVFFRPEHGGLEWTVPVSGLSRVLCT